MIAPYLASILVNLFKPENKSQFILIKDPYSTKMNDFLINEFLPVTLYSNILTLRDTNKSFKLDGDILKTMKNYKFNADHVNLSDKKLFREFAEKMNFDIKNKCRPNTRDRSVIRLLNSPAIVASEISTIFWPSDPNELCDRITLLLQEKQSGYNSEIINEEIVAIVINY